MAKRSMGRRETRTAAESDLAGRRYYCYLQKPGATSKIKRMARRRERHEAKRDLDGR